MPISDYLRQLRQKVGADLLLLPGVLAVVLDDHRRVLLMRSCEDGKWYLPGGSMDPGEQPADAVAREVLEETGLIVEPVRLVGVYAEDAPTRYTNGDVVWYVTNVFLCRVIGGELAVSDDEAMDVRFFAIDELPEIPASQRSRVQDAMAGDERTRFLRAVDQEKI